MDSIAVHEDNRSFRKSVFMDSADSADSTLQKSENLKILPHSEGPKLGRLAQPETPTSIKTTVDMENHNSMDSGDVTLETSRNSETINSRKCLKWGLQSRTALPSMKDTRSFRKTIYMDNADSMDSSLQNSGILKNLTRSEGPNRGGSHSRKHQRPSRQPLI
jgi:hypothetical protein